MNDIKSIRDRVLHRASIDTTSGLREITEHGRDILALLAELDARDAALTEAVDIVDRLQRVIADFSTTIANLNHDLHTERDNTALYMRVAERSKATIDDLKHNAETLEGIAIATHNSYEEVLAENEKLTRMSGDELLEAKYLALTERLNNATASMVAHETIAENSQVTIRNLKQQNQALAAEVERLKGG